MVKDISLLYVCGFFLATTNSQLTILPNDRDHNGSYYTHPHPKPTLSNPSECPVAFVLTNWGSARVNATSTAVGESRKTRKRKKQGKKREEKQGEKLVMLVKEFVVLGNDKVMQGCCEINLEKNKLKESKEQDSIHVHPRMTHQKWLMWYHHIF